MMYSPGGASHTAGSAPPTVSLRTTYDTRGISPITSFTWNRAQARSSGEWKQEAVGWVTGKRLQGQRHPEEASASGCRQKCTADGAPVSERCAGMLAAPTDGLCTAGTPGEGAGWVTGGAIRGMAPISSPVVPFVISNAAVPFS